MKNKLIRWRLSQADVQRLTRVLRPIRTQEEAAALLGCSAALISQIERSALRKVINAITRLEPIEPEPEGNPT